MQKEGREGVREGGREGGPKVNSSNKRITILFLPHGCSKRVERAVVVRLCMATRHLKGRKGENTSKKRAEREERRPDVIHCRPLVLKDVKADAAVDIDVWMEARSDELDGRRSTRIVGGKDERELVSKPCKPHHRKNTMSREEDVKRLSMEKRAWSKEQGVGSKE